MLSRSTRIYRYSEGKFRQKNTDLIDIEIVKNISNISKKFNALICFTENISKNKIFSLKGENAILIFQNLTQICENYVFQTLGTQNLVAVFTEENGQIKKQTFFLIKNYGAKQIRLSLQVRPYFFKYSGEVGTSNFVIYYVQINTK